MELMVLSEFENQNESSLGKFANSAGMHSYFFGGGRPVSARLAGLVPSSIAPSDVSEITENDRLSGEMLSPRRIVSYVRRTIRVHLDGLERRDQPGRLLPLDGCAPVGVVGLRGHVDWPEPDPSLRQPLRVRVWVNDFEQFDAPLGAPQGLRRTFRTLD